MGLVDYVSAPGKALEKARAVAKQVLELPQAGERHVDDGDRHAGAFRREDACHAAFAAYQTNGHCQVPFSVIGAAGLGGDWRTPHPRTYGQLN